MTLGTVQTPDFCSRWAILGIRNVCNFRKVDYGFRNPYLKALLMILQSCLAFSLMEVVEKGRVLLFQAYTCELHHTLSGSTKKWKVSTLDREIIPNKCTEAIV
jgi:hypothetical protein